MAIAAMVAAQISFCQSGVFLRPPDASMSTTMAPESAEVTKNTSTITMATSERMYPSGKCSRKAKSAWALSASTAWPRLTMPCAWIM